MPGIVSGGAWIAQRRSFLQAELAKDPRPEQRGAIEAELAALDQERAKRRRRWWRWLVIGGRSPT